MLAFVLAAVVAQPLDAVYSTAGNPASEGVNLALRYPAGWRVAAGDPPHGIANIISPDGAVRIAIWTDPRALEFRARKNDGDQTAQAYYLGPLAEWLNNLMPDGAIVSEGWYATVGNRPAQCQEYRAADGSYAGCAVAFLVEWKPVVLWCNCVGPNAVARYQSAKPLFAAIGETISEPVAQSDHSAGAVAIGLAAAVAAVGIAWLAHRRTTSSTGFRLSQGRFSPRRSRR